MSTVGVILKNPFDNGHVPSEAQLKAYDKAYRELKSQILTQDKEFSAKQTQKLKETLESLQDIKGKATASRIECEHKIQQLRKQSKTIEKTIADYEAKYKSTNHEAEFKQRIYQQEQLHISNCKRRVEIANTIDVKAFLKLDIEERKADAHDVFRWIIVALYGQPENKYYWPNFKEQAIEEDKGADLIERLGKIDAFHAKQEQRVRTAKFLENFETTRKAPELKKYQKQIDSIREIAKLFYSSSEAGRKIKELNKQIEKSRAAFLKDDEEKLQNIKNNTAILERIRVSQAYTEQLKAMEALLGGRLDKYNHEIAAGQAYAAELSKIESYVVEYKAPVQTQEKRDQCECSIY